MTGFDEENYFLKKFVLNLKGSLNVELEVKKATELKFCRSIWNWNCFKTQKLWFHNHVTIPLTSHKMWFSTEMKHVSFWKNKSAIFIKFDSFSCFYIAKVRRSYVLCSVFISQYWSYFPFGNLHTCISEEKLHKFQIHFLCLVKIASHGICSYLWPNISLMWQRSSVSVV